MDSQQPAVWLQPSNNRVRALYVAGVPGILAALAYAYGLYVRMDRDYGPTVAAVADVALAIFFLALVAFGSLYWRTVRLYADGSVLGRVDPLGRRREIPINTVGRVVAVKLRVPRGPTQERWLFLDRTGRGLFAVNPRGWDPDGLNALLRRIGQQLQRDDELEMSVYAAARQYPGIYPQYLAHPWMIAGVSAVLIVLVGFIIAAMGGGSAGHT